MVDFLNTEVGVTLVTGIFALIGIVVGDVLRRQHKAIGEVRVNSAAAREQVQNSHSTNLRDDIDSLKDGISSLLTGQHQQTDSINNLAQDLAWERRERMDVSERVTRLENSLAA